MSDIETQIRKNLRKQNPQDSNKYMEFILEELLLAKRKLIEHDSEIKYLREEVRQLKEKVKLISI